MIVLGINAFHGDASACLIEDGQIISAVAEERFTRNKHEGGLPLEGIKWCMKQTDKKITDVAVSRDPRLFWGRKALAGLQNPRLFGVGLNRLSNADKINQLGAEIKKILGYNVRFHRVEHHLSHLAYAFVTSGFEKSALLSIDGFGDFVSTTWGTGNAGSVKINHRIFFPHSLGAFYTAVTQFLGFTGYGEEYKVMALASYGQPRYEDVFNQIIRPTRNGFRLNPRYFNYNKKGVEMSYGAGTPFVGPIFCAGVEKILGPRRLREEVLTERHYDLAYSMQAVTTKIILNLAQLVKKQSGEEKLAIAGGVGLNGVANGALVEKSGFKEVWFPSAPADDGTAIGAAAVVALENGDRFYGKTNRSPFLAPEYKTEPGGAEELLPESAVIEQLAGLLADGKIVGWYDGRGEFGPRALGHRSILADPRKTALKEKINAIVKKRENFRPFAPMVLASDAEKYFEMKHASPNMMVVVAVKAEWRKRLSAITHVDGTARVQTVEERELPLIHKLMVEWRRITGISVLLNTSFNENEPIVNTPEEALACYQRTAIDALFLNGKLLKK